jgi:hypothetical protein
MLDYEVHRCTRRCAATERELAPSEPFYSVLVQEDAEIIRRDYCVDAWPGPPENAIGFWKSEMPDPAARKLHWAPNDVLRHYFRQLIDQGNDRDTAYVLALLLVRRRLMRLEDTERSEGQEILVLYCPQAEQQYRVPVVEPTTARVQEIQEHLAKMLFAEAE